MHVELRYRLLVFSARQHLDMFRHVDDCKKKKKKTEILREANSSQTSYFLP